jgi:DNA-binding HxlR family transcriptional regulator
MKLEDCPVKATLDVIGGKWKTIILNELKNGPLHFGALRRLAEGASHKVLTAQLRQLEADGILTRSVTAETPPRMLYALSARGESLRQILIALCEWGQTYRERNETRGSSSLNRRPEALP